MITLKVRISIVIAPLNYQFLAHYFHLIECKVDCDYFHSKFSDNNAFKSGSAFWTQSIVKISLNFWISHLISLIWKLEACTIRHSSCSAGDWTHGFLSATQELQLNYSLSLKYQCDFAIHLHIQICYFFHFLWRRKMFILRENGNKRKNKK